MQSRMCARHHVGRGRIERHHAVEVLGRLVEAAARQAVEHVREQRAFFEHRVGDARIGALGLVGVEGLGLEADRLLVKAEREPVRAQLVDRVPVEQFVGRGRLRRTRAGRLRLTEQDVMVGDQARLAQLVARRIGLHAVALFEGGCTTP